ncbi:MAG: SprB repeat-containing protein, partial [Bacteroidia bacterium]|nr:SprB repeat-containing protein [Bacteroidia bacterium]
MSLSTRRLLFILFNCFTFAFLSAQTLYWVGGSGNFNDPQHWSLTSGGPIANKTPDAFTDVIFDDNSGLGPVDIVFTGASHIKSGNFHNRVTEISLLGDQYAQITIGGDFVLNQRTYGKLSGKLVFKTNPNSSEKKYVNFYGSKFNSDVDFISGNWALTSFSIDDSKTVRFLSGNYYLNSTTLRAGNFITGNETVKFYITKGFVRAKSSFSIGTNTSFETDQAYFDIKTNQSTTGGSGQLPNLGSGSKVIGGGGNTVNACTASLSAQGVSCAGNTDGKLFVYIDPSCSNGPFNLIWNNPGGSCATVTLTGVSAGTYTINNMNATGSCSYDFLLVDNSNNPLYSSNQVAITGPTQISFNFFGSPITSCFGFCDGSITAVLGGGTPNYSINLTPPTGPVQNFVNQTGGIKTFTGLCTGVHTFSITDANGCSRTFTQMVNQPATLTPNPITSSITCNSFSNGALAIAPQGGTANYTVNFSIGAPQVTGVSGTVSSTGLPPGPISATLTDSKGCTAVVNTVIAQPSALSITPSQTNVSCNGGNNGAASVLISGGTPTYAVNWSPTAGTGTTISNLLAGVHTATITDLNSCTTTAVFTITQPPAITLTPTFTNIICAGSCTGAINITPSGGTGSSWSYTWVSSAGPSTVATGTANFQNTLCANTYSIYGRDANLCVTPVPTVVTISEPPTVTLTIVTKSVSCFGLSDGGATVTPSGGNGPAYTFSWSPGVFTGSAVNTFSANNYNLTVFDSQSCPTNTVVSIIQPTSGLTASSAAFSLNCHSANAPCNGSITVSPTGGTTPYQYTLTTSSTVIIGSPPFTGLCAGSYTVNVSDNAGCPTTPSVLTVNQPPVLVPSLAVTSSVSCFSGTNGALSGTATGGTPAYTFTWTTPTLGTFNTTTITNLPAGIYTLNARDSHSCTANNTIAVTQPTADISITLNTNSITCFAT